MKLSHYFRCTPLLVTFYDVPFPCQYSAAWNAADPPEWRRKKCPKRNPFWIRNPQMTCPSPEGNRNSLLKSAGIDSIYDCADGQACLTFLRPLSPAINDLLHDDKIPNHEPEMRIFFLFIIQNFHQRSHSPSAVFPVVIQAFVVWQRALRFTPGVRLDDGEPQGICSERDIINIQQSDWVCVADISHSDLPCEKKKKNFCE